jgi:hypothetical protein
MKLTSWAISLFLVLVIAAPIEVAEPFEVAEPLEVTEPLEVAELSNLGQGDKEPHKATKDAKPKASTGGGGGGGCSVGFVFARGSTEMAPLVLSDCKTEHKISR